MSSFNLNTCNAKCIVSSYQLERCNNQTKNVYCDKHQVYNNKDKCAICMEEIDENNQLPLECGHWYHKECITPTNIHSCPLCKRQMRYEEITYIFGEGHVEQNNYNDGTSVYYNYSNIDENAYSEFGHGEFMENDDDDGDGDEEDSYFIDFDDDTRLQLLLFDDDTSDDELIERASSIDRESWEEIVINISFNQSNSEFFQVENILTFINSSDIEDYDGFFSRLINKVVKSEYEYQTRRTRDHLDIFWCSKDLCIRYISDKIKSNFQYNRMIKMYYNITKLLFATDNRDQLRQIMNAIESFIKTEVHQLKKFYLCPESIRLQITSNTH
jgi:hypothetical protein